MTDDANRQLRLAIYALLIAVSVGTIIGRIGQMRADHGKHPFMSANDRSRWTTIRSLVDHGTFAIDDVIADRRWDSIDKVYHVGADGKRHYYSSKPPLLAVLLAGEYWVVKSVMGLSLGSYPFYVARIMLVITNVGLLLVMFASLVSLVERYGRSDWGKIFVIASAAFATFLTTFAITLNNHLIAAVAAMLAIDFALRIWIDGRRESWLFFGAGLMAAFAAANDLPAFSLFGILGLALLIQSPSKTLLAGVPGALIIAAASFGTTYWAHGSWKPPYAHRSDGPAIAQLDAQAAGDAASELNDAKVPTAVRSAFAEQGITLSETPELQVRAADDRWVLDDPVVDRRWALQKVDDGIEIRSWDRWYDYADTYWREGVKKGVDLGEQSRLTYAFHMLLGHHGVFSLTPIWILSVIGGVMLLRSEDRHWRDVAILVATLTIVCILFYTFRPLKDRNYGGVCSGFRWLFWLIPLWLVMLQPAADWCAQRRWMRWTATILLAISAASAAYPALNPWSHPWIYRYLQYLGWL
ncbi:hypothetical protein [Blastopirellula marina]|uniref:Glycosyltransferase RgtA/B/C/D-like domain-containing protein n=1 Tax=Blastopirellula marina DSM 3645 TaxID=314230 RepID=A4A2F9_9BACT|nr:hypothetical protein [Blastopirellula marina]EAQ77026.1 hypothetical protein DSM3645_04220 [Blastopirellula marina DSM 3645]